MNWADIISNNAFTIVGCIALAWYIYYLNKQHKAEMEQARAEHKNEMDQVRAEHKTEMKEITRAVDKLSSGIDKILSKLG